MKELPNEEDLTVLTDYFKVLGDPTRVKIILLLSEREYCVSDLASTLEVTESAVSHQLRLLKGNRLVAGRREGKSVFYSVIDDHVLDLLKEVMETREGEL